MDPKVFGRDYEQAFPCPERVSDGWRGMSLRDYFAAQALDPILIENEADTDRIAAFAYRIADSMLKERAK